MRNILISIVIVTYNSSGLIEECLKSIKDNNDIGDKLEIIIVDNDSKDLKITEKMAKKIFSDIRIIKNTKNGGYGQGNNIGIAASLGNIIMIMNPDVRLFEPIFKYSLMKFENPNLGILGMRQYETIDQPRQSFISLSSDPLSLLRYKLYNYFNIFNPKHFCIHGACFFVRKEVMKRINYFDENIFLYGEEIDIHLRIIKNTDFKIVWDKKIGYIHPMHMRKETSNSIMQRIKSYNYIINKNGLNQKAQIRKMILTYRVFMLRSYIKNNKMDERMYGDIIKSLKQFL